MTTPPLTHPAPSVEAGSAPDNGGLRRFRTAAVAVDPVAAGAAALAVCFLLALAVPMLRWWYWEFTKPNSYYGHAFFIPFLVTVLVWHRRGAIAATPCRPWYALLGIFIPSLTLHLAAIRGDMQAVMSWSFLAALTSGVGVLVGPRLFRVLAVPLAFLWLMAPLPGPVLNDATLGLQKISERGAFTLLTAAGLHPTQQGNLIQLDNYAFNVDVPCAGFKLLLCLMTFSAAFVCLTDARRTGKIGLLLFSFPLALVVNSLRIALIGVVGECFGVSAAAAFHDWSGILCLGVCMALLFSTAKVMGCRTLAGQPLF